MNVEEFKEFMTLSPPKHTFVQVNVYPSQELAKEMFNCVVSDYKNQGIVFQVHSMQLKISHPSYGDIYFMSVSNMEKFKGFNASAVYVHPTIKEVII